MGGRTGIGLHDLWIVEVGHDRQGKATWGQDEVKMT